MPAIPEMRKNSMREKSIRKMFYAAAVTILLSRHLGLPGIR
jgi:hypothetical protein